MIDRIKEFLIDRRARSHSRAGHSADERQLAAAALLVEVAAVDANFDENERSRIALFVREKFGLNESETRTLLASATAEVDASAQLFAFTRAIAAGFSYDDRVALMQTLWEVALADGTVDPYEDQLLRRIAGLINVTDRDRGIARKQAEAVLRATR